MRKTLLPLFLGLALLPSGCHLLLDVSEEVGTKEICNNQQDDDNNGLTDCEDPHCSTFPGCGVNNTTNTNNPVSELCNNGLDDDEDSFVDCDDQDCHRHIECQGMERCGNHMDDDGDLLVDCDDPDCALHGDCQGVENCGNGVDDDEDGDQDCEDSDCASSLLCLPESNCNDGIDNDLDDLVDCADPDCISADNCTPSSCNLNALGPSEAGSACPAGYYCAIDNQADEPYCRSEADNTSTNGFYDQPCRGWSDCPIGSFCEASWGVCAPFCGTPGYSTSCPSGGTCNGTFQSGLRYCQSSSICTPFPDNCGVGMRCLPQGNNTFCVADSGLIPAGGACINYFECQGHAVCVDGTCSYLCELFAQYACPNGECIDALSSVHYGICAEEAS